MFLLWSGRIMYSIWCIAGIVNEEHSLRTQTLLTSWVCLGSAGSLCQDLWLLWALTIMGSTKQQHRVQPGPGSLQCWSLLQATTGIKSQLHTSVKAKHYRLQLLSFLSRGGTPAVSGTAPRHPKPAGSGSLVPGFPLSQLYSQSINKTHFNTCRGFSLLPMPWHTEWHWEHAHSPASPLPLHGTCENSHLQQE